MFKFLLTCLLILAALVGFVFVRALSTKLATGKWPHEDEEALSVYKTLP